MKTVGIVRNVDQLGRIVIPMETKKSLGINSGDSVEFYTEGDKIIIKKFTTKCVICDCDEKEKLKKYNDRPVCEDCIEKMAQIKMAKIMAKSKITEEG